MLIDKNILTDKGETYKIFTSKITGDFLKDATLPLSMTPSEYVTECWNRYENYKSSLSKTKRVKLNSLNGNIFQVIIATAFYRNKVKPFFVQASSHLVPGVDYDIIMYDKENDVPITVSLKTSSRERYKQADLEAYAFKNVYRTALNYLVMMDSKSCIDVQKKIDEGKTLGLEKVIQANKKEFDDFVNELKKMKLGVPPKVPLFEGRKIK